LVRCLRETSCCDTAKKKAGGRGREGGTQGERGAGAQGKGVESSLLKESRRLKRGEQKEENIGDEGEERSQTAEVGFGTKGGRKFIILNKLAEGGDGKKKNKGRNCYDR